jgi:hypothetical protein
MTWVFWDFYRPDLALDLDPGPGPGPGPGTWPLAPGPWPGPVEILAEIKARPGSGTTESSDSERVGLGNADVVVICGI